MQWYDAHGRWNARFFTDEAEAKSFGHTRGGAEFVMVARGVFDGPDEPPVQAWAGWRVSWPDDPRGRSRAGSRFFTDETDAKKFAYALGARCEPVVRVPAPPVPKKQGWFRRQFDSIQRIIMFAFIPFEDASKDDEERESQRHGEDR